VAYTLEWIAGRIGGRVRGNKDRVVRSVCPPERPEKNSIVFIKNRKMYSGVDRTAGACFVFGFNAEDEPADDCILVDPKKSSTAFVELLSLFEEPDGTGPGVSGSASIAPGAEIGEGASVGPFAVVPNPRTGKGPVVRLDGPSGAVWLPMETDGDVVDLVTRVRGTAPDGFGGRPSDAYRAAWARAPR